MIWLDCGLVPLSRLQLVKSGKEKGERGGRGRRIRRERNNEGEEREGEKYNSKQYVNLIFLAYIKVSFRRC